MSTFGSAPQNEPEQGTSIRGKPGEILRRVSYEKDKVIFNEGHDGTDAYVLESGRIGVFKVKDGKSVRLAVLEKGAMFGEMAAITGERRSATTIALEHCIVVQIPRSTMQSKMAACDPFIKALLAIMINNVSRVNERYATTSTVAEKLLNDLKAAHTVIKESALKAEAPAAATTPAAAAATPADKAAAEAARKRGVDGGVSG